MSTVYVMCSTRGCCAQKMFLRLAHSSIARVHETLLSVQAWWNSVALSPGRIWAPESATFHWVPIADEERKPWANKAFKVSFKRHLLDKEHRGKQSGHCLLSSTKSGGKHRELRSSLKDCHSCWLWASFTCKRTMPWLLHQLNKELLHQLPRGFPQLPTVFN